MLHVARSTLAKAALSLDLLHTCEFRPVAFVAVSMRNAARESMALQPCIEVERLNVYGTTQSIKRESLRRVSC